MVLITNVKHVKVKNSNESLTFYFIRNKSLFERFI